VTAPQRLKDVLSTTTFPLFAIRPGEWSGACFLGFTSRANERLCGAQFHYLDALDERSMGACVSSIDGARAQQGDPIEAHLVPFISRFDDEFLVSRVKRNKFEPFKPGEFTTKTAGVHLAGRNVGGTIYAHSELPVILLRAAIRIGAAVTDIGIAGWRLDPADLLPKVVLVDAIIAAEFDALIPPEPHIEWDEAE
jgi:hypothetical protein